MKRASIFLCLVVLCTGVAWAEEEAEAAAPEAVESVVAAESIDFGEPFGAELDGGGCELPDLTGLSDGEIGALAGDFGFSVSGQTDAQTPMCPVTSSCPNITNCGVGNPCSAAILGPCCTTSSGLGLCCVSGNIKVKKCACVCTGSPCALSCVASQYVRWGCV